jgi:hypothetical protein
MPVHVVAARLGLGGWCDEATPGRERGRAGGGTRGQTYLDEASSRSHDILRSIEERMEHARRRDGARPPHGQVPMSYRFSLYGLVIPP